MREIAPGLYVTQSSLDTTTSTVVVRGNSAVLVDPAWTPAELDLLAAELAARGWEVTAGFSTHAHHDHLLWHPGFGTAPRWASAMTVRMATEHREELVTALGADWPDDLAELMGRISPLPQQEIPHPFGVVDEEPMEVVVHDGHAPGHSALWLPDRGVLIAGDMLSDIELPLPFWPDDLPAYLHGLEVLEPYVARARILVPGHGNPTDDPIARLDADRRYLDAILAGRDAPDGRRANPGMAENHTRMLELAREQATDL